MHASLWIQREEKIRESKRSLWGRIDENSAGQECAWMKRRKEEKKVIGYLIERLRSFFDSSLLIRNDAQTSQELHNLHHRYGCWGCIHRTFTRSRVSHEDNQKSVLKNEQCESSILYAEEIRYHARARLMFSILRTLNSEHKVLPGKFERSSWKPFCSRYISKNAGWQNKGANSILQIWEKLLTFQFATEERGSR